MERLSLAPPLALLCSVFSGAGGRLSLLPVVQAAAAEKQRQAARLTGTWMNELGSTMVLGEPDAAGAFRGTYTTAVTASEEPPRESPLVGAQQHRAGRPEQATFGFTVNWSFSDSTAVFAGQHFVDAEGREALETTWLLREQADSRGADWKATRVGRNVFTRVE